MIVIWIILVVYILVVFFDRRSDSLATSPNSEIAISTSYYDSVGKLWETVDEAVIDNKPINNGDLLIDSSELNTVFKFTSPGYYKIYFKLLNPDLVFGFADYPRSSVLRIEDPRDTFNEVPDSSLLIGFLNSTSIPTKTYFSGITPRFILDDKTVVTNESPSALDNNPYIEDWYVEMKYARGDISSSNIDNSFATCYRGKNLSYVLSLKSLLSSAKTSDVPENFLATLTIKYSNAYLTYLLQSTDVEIPELSTLYAKTNSKKKIAMKPINISL